LTSDRVYQWRLLLEEYAPDIIYIKGTHNTFADAVSQLNPTNEYTQAKLGVSTKKEVHKDGNLSCITGEAITKAKLTNKLFVFQ
jgi:hypothetical protein